ncbi:hypothetical protein [Amaricoccus sp.]|uniref:hypothetical protein n=1 Tax=Amaricoccus sp. TaxID=1872485 RepID=UPI001B3E7DF6|nr:hypothetical protein [Amaricoccus sp.]MBP7000648.1 hypothetical protein [Amaricoccus sp.]
MTFAPDDLGRALSDLAEAIFDRRGEAATVDMTRVPPAAPKRPEDAGKAREGKK